MDCWNVTVLTFTSAIMKAHDGSVSAHRSGPFGTCQFQEPMSRRVSAMRS